MGFLVLLALTIEHGFVSASERSTFERHLRDGDLPDRTRRIAPPSDGITVITADSNQWRSEGCDGPRATSELVAIDRNGTVLYHEDSHDRY